MRDGGKPRSNRIFERVADVLVLNIGGHERGEPYGGKKYFSPYANPQMEDGSDGEHLTERLGRETAKFITENKDKPFLAYLSFYSVHTPLMAPKDLVEKY